MDSKQIGMDRRCQSAVMCVVMAFSFCLFLWIFAAAKAPDVRFDSEQAALISGEWRIEYQGEEAMAPLPGPFSPERGVQIRYSIELGDYGVNGNSVMLRGIHEYVKIYLDGEEIDEFGYGQKTPFGNAPYNAWVTARLPEDWQGKTLTVEIVKYYDSLSGQLEYVYIGTKNALVFQVIRGCLPTMIFNFAIILAALLLLVYSYIFNKKYITYQLRCLCIFSLVTCTWLVLESGGYQIFWGRAPVVSNTLFLLFYLIPPAAIRFILTYESFAEDRWMNLLYWLSILNCVAVSILQIAGISDFIESLIGAHVILVLIMAELLFHFIWKIFHGEEVKDIQLMAACLSFAVFAGLDIIRFYKGGSAGNSAYFSQIGVVVFFGVLIYYALQKMVEERDESTKRMLLEHMAYTDLLTNLPNRNAFEKQMAQMRGCVSPGRITVVADLNELKRINDQWGHQKGDEALVFVAGALKKSVRDEEGIYRIGGDEFCILSDKLSEADTEEFAARLSEYLEEAEAELGFPVAVAVGWAEEDECGIDLAFRRADFTMYERKQQMKRKGTLTAAFSQPPECSCGDSIDETK